MLSLFFRQPRLVALAFLVIVSAGASSLLTIGRQEDPTITNLFATISTVYPGADPARVESLVTERIEAELREVPEITVIESNSATGISVVSVELAETLTESEIDEAWDTVRREIEDARALFPVGVLEPEIDTDGAGTYTAIFSLQSAGNAPPSVAPRYAEELAQQLRRLPGTDRVQVFGAPEEEVRVTVDIHAAAAMGLSMDRIAAAVRDSDAKVQAGSLRTDRGEMLIEVEGEITALDRIRRIPLSTGMDGAVARLGDIATVERGVRTPVSETAIVDGAPAILVAARVEPGLQVDTWMAMVREEAGDFRRALPASLTLDQFFDQSTYTLDRLAEVGGNMALGVALVIAVLLVTLGLRSAVIVGLMLPVVSLASIATMQFAGMEIHQMSVTGLIVALGLLVDAAIVMADEVAKGLRHGSDRRAAVETAVRRLFGPLLASTVTTALSFMPMVLLPGPAGDFVGSIALAVIIMLFWSLATALTLTPALAGWFLRSGAGGGIRGGALARAFRWTLSWSMRHPVNAIGYALVLPLAGFLSFPTLTAQFFPGVERDQFTIEVEFPAGTAIDRTTEAIAELDAEIRAEGGIESIAWVIG
ncbi:MAG: efflux RND transporter permease subunit, partial [Rubricella sp.]